MITSFQRSMFLQQLREKQSQWKLPATQNKYFNNFQTAPKNHAPSFGIERDQNGYFYLSDDLIAYCNLRNGLIVRIRKNWADKDWACYSELYKISQTSGDFRIDIPLYREITNVDGVKWEYAELQSPGNSYGKNSDDDVFEWPELTDGLVQNNNITDEYKDQVAQYYKDYVDQSSIILKYAVQISNKHGTGLPMNLCRPSTRYRDDVGYFWSDFDQDQWIISKVEALEFYLMILAGTVHFAKSCGVIDDSRIQSILTYAREKWTTI